MGGVKVLLHVLHRDQDLTEDGTIAWSTLYNNYIEEINAYLLGSPIDDEEELFLTEMGQKPNFDCSSDLGSRDMDRNHDWINDPRERYTDLVDIDTFLSRNPKIDEGENNTFCLTPLQCLRRNNLSEIEHTFHNIVPLLDATIGKNNHYLIKYKESPLEATATHRNKETDPNDRARVGFKVDAIFEYQDISWTPVIECRRCPGTVWWSPTVFTFQGMG
ncbi:uncharacterized protein OCT59_013249 [Rhizophagus irregularis]|uniref:uncharacterized protein n=1 Tax=Rhizophagus irregularis TaxID=588596 RepID=UPI00333467C5|nr:hypothetical protein OCT59_013249 [Rhizophagus irregularis]